MTKLSSLHILVVMVVVVAAAVVLVQKERVAPLRSLMALGSL